MKRNTQANDEKVLRYSLRKYKLGLASVTIGAVFLSFAASSWSQGRRSSVNTCLKYTGRIS